EQGFRGHPYFHVKLIDGRTGYAPASQFGSLADVDPAIIAAECKRRGNPRVGMSAKQVEAPGWGKPGHVDRRETARGISDGSAYGNGRYVILRNGIVTSVQMSGTLR